jgi:hypothetical protein
MNNLELLHNKFNPRYDQISPVRIKNFKRENLAELFRDLDLKVGVEVGTSQGLYSLVLCQTIPNLTLSCVDPYMKYHWKHSEEEHERCYNLAHERLDPFGVNIIRKTSMDGVKLFEDNSLDFVYIDGNHEFDFAMQDLIEWSKKVKPFGIISGHDYYRFRRAGVVDAVNAYTNAHQVHEWFVCDEREVSFFWVKDDKWT